MPTYLGGTFSPLLDISERNYSPRWGGARAPSAPPPAYAPVTYSEFGVMYSLFYIVYCHQIWFFIIVGFEGLVYIKFP